MVVKQLHPEVAKFIEEVEEEARKKGHLRFKVGNGETGFLENVWGPATGYNFEGLKVEFPFIDFKGGLRFADFYYIRGPIRLIIEIDDYSTHAGQISKEKHNDHTRRQNHLLLKGWFLVRFTYDQVLNEPTICQAELMQAIGHCWTIHNKSHPLKASEAWVYYKNLLILHAVQNGGVLRPAKFAVEHQINRSTANRWAKRASSEGAFQPLQVQTKVTAYKLNERMTA